MRSNKRQTLKKGLKVQNISEHLKSIKAREKALFCYSNDSIMVLMGGMYFDMEEFNKAYPVIELQGIRTKGDNPDKTREFIRNKKSY